MFGRKIRVRYILLGDILLTAISVLISFVLRLDLPAIFPTYTVSFFWMLGIALFIKPIVYYFFGMYRRIWRYASIRELMLIITSASVASFILSILMILLLVSKTFSAFPRSTLVIDWALSILLIGGLRFSSRVLAENRPNPTSLRVSKRLKNIAIVGAGDAGAMVIKELQKNPQLSFTPIGFLDDDPEKQKNKIHGIPVIGTLSELGHILKVRQIDEVIIAIPSAPGKVIRKVTETCQENRVPFRTMPAIYELLDGKINVSRLREVNIDDLLRRDPARIDNAAIGASMQDKVILVTGAGGSIGRELCRQIARNTPKQLLLMGHGENSIFEALLELKEGFPDLPMQPIIADVRDPERLRGLIAHYKPQIVFHTAAHKHVPLMEVNIEEAITNNVLGTHNLVQVCLGEQIEKLIMISTDKAIRPANIMGSTKRLAEMLVLDAARQHGAPFSVVRFGNVLGSRGSVVPRFKQQIAKGGPVTITHPGMRRYFMTIPEAVHLVLQASIMGKGGETFVLNMGEQVKILDLAQDLIRLSGLEPGKDIEIQFLGVRPGEKLSEELWDEGFEAIPTDHPDVFKVDNDESLSSKSLDALIDQLLELARSGEKEAIIKLIESYIPGASLQSETPDLTIIA